MRCQPAGARRRALEHLPLFPRIYASAATVAATSETRDAITRLWHFCQLIGNTDMYDGNLSFVPGEPGLRLAPVYDMLPMLYAPQRGVELPERQFAARLPLPSERELWHQAARAAVEMLPAVLFDDQHGRLDHRRR